MEQLKERFLLKVCILFVIRVLCRSAFRPCHLFQTENQTPMLSIGNSLEIHGMDIPSRKRGFLMVLAALLVFDTDIEPFLQFIQFTPGFGKTFWQISIHFVKGTQLNGGT